VIVDALLQVPCCHSKGRIVLHRVHSPYVLGTNSALVTFVNYDVAVSLASIGVACCVYYRYARNRSQTTTVTLRPKLESLDRELRGDQLELCCPQNDAVTLIQTNLHE
jgi:hypothetical protein